MRVIVFALAAIALLCALSCQRKDRDLPVGAGASHTAYQEFGKATLLSYAGQHRKWRLDADFMRKPLGDTGTILAVPVELSLFDTTGRSTTRILSDSGITTPKMESFTIWGSVYVRTKDDLVVRTERISLDYQTRMWHSDTFVEIRTAKGDVLRGKGFDAREDFSHSSFKRSVSGSFPEFRRRLESDDSFL